MEAISRELWRKRTWVVPELEKIGYVVLQANAKMENASGIITFYRPETDMEQLHGQLEQNHVVTSLRVDRGGQRYIRMSPHFYNTDAELRRVLELL
jgi:selenocysteine lyase/cysteine desulfurase